MPELEYISVEYSSSKEEFLKNLKHEKETNLNSNFLQVTNIPSARNAIELILQEWFKSIICENKDILGLNLNIEEKVDGNFKELPRYFELNFRDYFIITFQSSTGDCESMTYWKVPNREQFYSTFIDDDKDEVMLQFLHEFLVEEFYDDDSAEEPNNEAISKELTISSGVMSAFKEKTEILLHELGNDLNSNLLMMAALWNNVDVVKLAVTREFDVDYKNDYEDMAIDKAWSRFIGSDVKDQKEPEEIILCLLNANSVYPKNFNYDLASAKIKQFVDISEGLYRDVKKGNFDSLNLKLKEHPILMHFYNRKNKSLLLHALETRKFKIIDYLDNGLNVGAHELLKFSDQYKELYNEDLTNLREQHKINAKELPKTYLLVLRSKTKIGSNDQLAHVRRKNVEETYDALDKNDFCSLLLQVAAQVKSIKIFFDFKHESIYYLDPMKKITTLGTTYPNGTIFIGAKQLLDESTKNKVLSTVAHELCHLAVLVTYMNTSFDPFPMGDSEEKQMYINKVMDDCRKKKELEPIVSNAFGYSEHLQASELIVTVAEMLMCYKNDEAKIDKIQETFEQLFKYAKEVVEPEMYKALIVLRKLGDPEINIRYDSLTDAMKKSISHLSINLQGVKTTFYDLFGDDDTCQEFLTSDNIRDILLNGKGMQIGEMCKLDPKYTLIERSFMNRETYQQLKSSDIEEYNMRVNARSKSMMRIRKNTIKFFILADFGGTGKTTFFKDAAIKVKNHHKNYWVSYVNLRKSDKVFVAYKPKLCNLNANDVMEILSSIVQNGDGKLSAFEEKIFKKLFARNQVVLFLDGVDEICPEHTELVMAIFDILKKCRGKNEIWISTRPHYANPIQNIFKVTPICFVLYTMEQKVKFIKDILNKNGITDETEETNAVGQINAFIFHLNWEPGFFSDPDHPLIIEIITEIYVQKRELKLDASSFYGLYAAMIDKQKEKVGNKIPNIERDPFSSLSVWQAHQVLAILVIFGELYDRSFQCTLPDGSYYNEGFSFTLEELSIIEKWRMERKGGRWTSDMIQRYAFVTVNLNNLLEDRSCIEFSHRTYAEFFIAQFLIDFLFNQNFNETEMIKMMHILQIVQGTPGLENTYKFIISFSKTIAKKEKFKFHPLIRLYFRKRIFKALIDKEELKYHSDPFIFFGKIIVCDEDLTRKLWRLNPKHERNSFEIIITHKDFKFLNLIIETANFVFDENWHETFNKSDKKLISDEQIEGMRDKIVESWDDWRKEKNLLKFCDYLHKNFDAKVQRKIHDKMVFAFHVTNQKILTEILKIMSEIYDKQTFTKKCIDNMFYPCAVGESIIFICKFIEELYAKDRNAIRKILFEDLRDDKSPLFTSFYTRNLELFLFIKDFYLKYQDSAEDTQNILLEIDIVDVFKYAVASELYADFKSFFAIIFNNNAGHNETMFREKVLHYISNDREAFEEFSENVENFINFIVFKE
ncbi:hypothetical protein ACKWTF_016632 [Chironomus riparius]